MKLITPTLETERLILKRGTLEDYLKVYEYDFTFLRDINGVNERVKYDPKKIEELVASLEDENILEFIIYEKNLNPVGNIVFDRFNKELNSLEVAINMHPDSWGLGYAKEAIVEIMRYIFANLNIDNIVYAYALENKKSMRVAEKLGFEPVRRYIEFYKKIKKNVKSEECIMSKERFYELYGEKEK